MQVTLNLPDIYFLEQHPREVAEQVKLYTALLMYHTGRISAGVACSIAGIDRYVFLYECKKHGIATVQYTAEDVANELNQFDI